MKKLPELGSAQWGGDACPRCGGIIAIERIDNLPSGFAEWWKCRDCRRVYRLAIEEYMEVAKYEEKSDKKRKAHRKTGTQSN